MKATETDNSVKWWNCCSELPNTPTEHPPSPTRHPPVIEDKVSAQANIQPITATPSRHDLQQKENRIMIISFLQRVPNFGLFRSHNPSRSLINEDIAR